MNILSVNSPLNHAFAAPGHNVLSLGPCEGVVDRAETAAAHGFRPDLVFQMESLGNPSF